MGISSLILELGRAVLTTIIRYKVNSDAADTADGFFELFKDSFDSIYDARAAHNQLSIISLKASKACQSVLNNIELSESRKEILVSNLITAFENMSLDYGTVVGSAGDVNKLSEQIKMSNQRYRDDLNPNEYKYYYKLVAHMANYTINAYLRLPDFTPKGILLLNEKISQIGYDLEVLVKQTEELSSNKYDYFESNYRMTLINTLRFINVYGFSTTISGYTNYDLDTSFIKLDFDFDDVSSSLVKNDITKSDWYSNKEYGKSKNIWISGSAGSGKTTYLQWLAVSIAKNEISIFGKNKLVPVLITARMLKEYSLKKCIEKSLENSDYSIPEGWINRCSEDNRFIYLIDGLDEVSPYERKRIFEWIKELDPHNGCIKVYTARPSVKEEENNQLKLLRDKLYLHICPMSVHQVRSFVLKWHKAVFVDDTNNQKSNVKAMGLALFNRIILSESLLKLATNPLLCAMICAINHLNNGNIPRSKMELYKECVTMLLEKRDYQRDINTDTISLRLEQKVLLFSKLAYWMMLNGHFAEAAYDDVVRQIDCYKSEMGISEYAEDILKFFLNRSGLIRVPEHGFIEFAHRSFLEYLCALQIQRENYWDFISNMIDNDNWRETIIDAISLANSQNATKIINAVLSKCSSPGTKSDEKVNKYWFLAFSLLNSAIEVEPGIRHTINGFMANLIPPRRGTEARVAVEVQDLAIPYLNNKKYDAETRLACIKTLRYIGGDKCLRALITYINESISFEETRIMCELFNECSLESIVAFDIPNILAETLKKHTGSILFNRTIKRILDEASEDIKEGLFERVTSVIYDAEYTWDYDEYSDDELTSIDILPDHYRFDNAHTLIINDNEGGEEYELSIIKHFPSVKKLYISSNVSIYSLNRYYPDYFHGIEEIILVINSTDYVDFSTIYYLKDCKDVELLLLNRIDEIKFETIENLKLDGNLRIGMYYEDSELKPILYRNIQHFNNTSIGGTLTICTDYYQSITRGKKFKKLRFASLRKEIEALVDLGIIISPRDESYYEEYNPYSVETVSGFV